MKKLFAMTDQSIVYAVTDSANVPTKQEKFQDLEPNIMPEDLSALE